ncbi:MAG TPA: endonuclease domain-containing protein, partial [Bacteroidia bacterium]|nr:endonuclease domain-containing protein [Bacteroidia bacterium]
MKENIKLPLYYGASMEIFRRAEILRKNMTESERLLWGRLNNNQIDGLKFHRQHPINQFIVDFYCHKVKLVIELDGGIHLKREVVERDYGREEILRNYGLEILRFDNDEV